MGEALDYLVGFGNHHESEAVDGVLPVGQNSPQRVAHDLYTEQISGTAFTVERARNRRSWLYRRRPSVRHLTGFRSVERSVWGTAPLSAPQPPPAQHRWDPPAIDAATGATWLSGMTGMVAAGDASAQTGASVGVYRCDTSMHDEVFASADGELLIVPQLGELLLVTEFGRLIVGPGEVAVVPAAVKFRVELAADGPARGWVCENHGALFELPEPGPIGTNALAMARDFRYPVAAPEDDAPTRMLLKYDGALYETELDHSPLDVVAWHGNHAPYVYDLRRYCAIGPVVFDHPDPSIWTVLTSPSDTPGMANLDLVLFRDRWSVAEHTFRPPWFHTNVMSEFMGLIDGAYDGKAVGFAPGGMSLHNAFLPHGPDLGTFEAASTAELEPQKLDGMLAFMLESRHRWRLGEWARTAAERQQDYADHWAGLERRSDV